MTLLALAPIIGLGITLFMYTSTNKSVAVLKSYSQSSGYAEQALNAIKVVVSYGQEVQEVKNYTTFLAEARRSGVKSGVLAAAAQGLFMFFIYLAYAYAFFMGGIWVEK